MLVPRRSATEHRAMRVGIQTWGTEGDVRPFFSLGSALRARGHDVRVVYTNIEARDFGPLARACDIEATAIGADYFEENRAHLAMRGRQSFEERSPLRQVRGILEDLMDPVAERMLDAGHALAKESDVFVSHFLAYPGPVAAEAARCPSVLVGLVPMFPSAHYAPIGVPSFGHLFHRLEWWIANRFFRSIFGPRINALRERVGLAQLADVLDPSLVRTRLGLVAVSPSLFPRPADWSPRAEVSGFLSLPDSAEAWEPDPALRAFFDAGPPPAFLSFGSMFNLDVERTTKVVAMLGEAVERAGVRGIIQAPDAVLRAMPARANVHPLLRAPHVHLFPRCSMIVHHGGAGTTQSALLAGRPSIVVPHAADQFYWGDVLAERGAGVKPLKATALTPERLASRIRDVIARPELAKNAEAIGRTLAAEQGPARAAELIEHSLQPS
jgi:sterol 3beta-glucosyltransferase